MTKPSRTDRISSSVIATGSNTVIESIAVGNGADLANLAGAGAVHDRDVPTDEPATEACSRVDEGIRVSPAGRALLVAEEVEDGS